MTGNTKKGNLTFKTAAIFFFISMGFEFYNITREATIFGMQVVHVPAIMSHLAYIIIYGSIGFGLWFKKAWGPKAVYSGTAFYSIDMLFYILNRKGIRAGLIKNLSAYGIELQKADMDRLITLISIIVLVVVICWIGFAVYTYVRRGYFIAPDRKN